MALILKKPSETGQWFKHTVQGVEIEIKIRPLTVRSISAARDKAREYDFVPHTVTGEMSRVTSINDEKMFAAQVDHMIEDFKGPIDENGAAVIVTPETKLLLWSAKPLENERTVADFVLSTAKQMAAADSREAAEETKK